MKYFYEYLMKDAKYIAERLNSKEKDILKKIKDNISINNFSENEIRNIEWLKYKGLIKIEKKDRKIIKLGKNGKEYLKIKLPEIRFLNYVKEGKSLRDIKNLLSKDEFNYCIGNLRKEGIINIEKGKIKIIKDNNFKNYQKILTYEGKDYLKLNEIEKEIIDKLIKRKDIIQLVDKPIKKLFLTELGNEVKKLIQKDEELIEQITPEIIKKETWKKVKIRKYDIDLPVPKTYPGRIHFLRRGIDYAKRIWIELGFKEMKSEYVLPAFWNFDTLYTPQDHPARELQDTFYVKNKIKMKLNENLVKRIKEVHENGGKTESKGWRYNWNVKEAKRLVLRTHTTSASAITLANLKKIPAKFFAIGEVFRNETWDWSHTSDFYQVEGIVVDENVNFRHLLGYLKLFFSKMGFDKVKFRPHYFPYTEMSVEIDVYHPVRKKWIELGGAGMFRPEVTVPLIGKEIPVLAWGPGLSRIIMDAYKLKSIRELKVNDIKVLREIKEWIK